MITKLSSLIGIHSFPSQRFTIQKKIRNRKLHPSEGIKQILVDVSVIMKEDAHTGIQRVVRGLLVQLFKNPPLGYCVVPVYCTRKHFYQYADKHFVERFNLTNETIPKGDVNVSAGDLFFGLDLAAHLLPRYENGLLAWKQQGVKIHILVYDMLPHLHPEWFTPRSVKNFRRWLKTISIYADQLICISETVKRELRLWLETQGFSTHTPRIATIPMGADIGNSLPSGGTDEETTRLIEQFKHYKFLLMVGTIEPRKGYADALDALESLWNDGEEIVLVIVGKAGWKTVKLQERLMNHSQAGEKLFWLKNVSDQTLQNLYEMAMGVLVTSYGEGFGLPIVEAIHYNKMILVRDIPIFREVTNTYPEVDFFGTDGISFAEKIRQLYHQNLTFSPTLTVNMYSWEDSALKLNHLFKESKKLKVAI